MTDTKNDVPIQNGAGDTNARVSHEPVLWGVGTSRTIRPIWAMHELGLRYQLRPILPRTGQTHTDEYTALNARQKVPLLQDAGLVLTESVAIALYLSDTYGTEQNRLIATDGVARAQCLEWCFFALSELDATSLYVLRRHRDLKHIYGEAEQANLAAIDYFHKQMRSVDRALAGGRSFLAGDRFSVADIVLTSCLVWAVRYEVPISAAALAYSELHTARAAYKAAELKNTPKPVVSHSTIL